MKRMIIVLTLLMGTSSLHSGAPTPAAIPLQPSVTTTPFLGGPTAQSGDLIFTINVSNIIGGFNPVTETFYLWSGNAASGEKHGLAVNTSNLNEVFVSNATADETRLYDSAGNTLGTYGSNAASFHPARMSVNPTDGALWIAAPGSSEVLRMPSGGGVAVSFTVGVGWPSGARIGPDGDLYIVGNQVNAISRRDLSADSLWPPQLYMNWFGEQHQDLNFDCSGRLWVLSNDQTLRQGHLREVDPANGNVLRTLDSFAPLAENGGGTLYMVQGVVQGLDGYLWVAMGNSSLSEAGLLKVEPDSLTPIQWFPLPQVIGGYDQGATFAPDTIAVLGVPLPYPACQAIATPTLVTTSMVEPPLPDSPGVVFPAPVSASDSVVTFGIPMDCDGQLIVRVWNLRGDSVGEVSRIVRRDNTGTGVVNFVSNGLAPGVYFFQAQIVCPDGSRQKLRPGKFLVKP